MKNIPISKFLLKVFTDIEAIFSFIAFALFLRVGASFIFQKGTFVSIIVGIVMLGLCAFYFSMFFNRLKFLQKMLESEEKR